MGSNTLICAHDNIFNKSILEQDACYFTNSEQISDLINNKIKVKENEFFKDERIQISIFLSITNVHVTRFPISGKVIYNKYNPGKYLLAWHPKSSEKNERTSVVIRNNYFGDILYRQIAGAVARRIVNYAQIDLKVIQGEDSGFIKFGSRVDLFLPLNSKIKVKLNQIVKGGKDTIAEK